MFVNVEVDEGVGNTGEKLAALGVEECCLFIVERSALLTNTYQTRDDEEVRIDLVADGRREKQFISKFADPLIIVLLIAGAASSYVLRYRKLPQALRKRHQVTPLH